VKERDHLEDLDVNDSNIETILKEIIGRVWT